MTCVFERDDEVLVREDVPSCGVVKGMTGLVLESKQGECEVAFEPEQEGSPITARVRASYLELVFLEAAISFTTHRDPPRILGCLRAELAGDLPHIFPVERKRGVLSRGLFALAPLLRGSRGDRTLLDFMGSDAHLAAHIYQCDRLTRLFPVSENSQESEWCLWIGSHRGYAPGQAGNFPALIRRVVNVLLDADVVTRLRVEAGLRDRVVFEYDSRA